MSSVALDINDLICGYRSPIVRVPRMHLEPGTLAAIYGVNGSGKSTFLKTIGLGWKPISGTVHLGAISALNLSGSERARMIGFLPSESPSHQGLSGYRAVALGRLPHLSTFGKLNESDHAMIQKAMSITGVGHLAEKSLNEMSDGERQRIMLARLLTQDTPVMLMDEPFAFLDVRAKIEIHALVSKIAREENKIVVMSTHETGLKESVADRCFFINAGVMEETPMAHIKKSFGL